MNTHIAPVLLCSALLWSLAPCSSVAATTESHKTGTVQTKTDKAHPSTVKTEAAADNSEATPATSDTKASPQENSGGAEEVTSEEPPAMKEAMRAYDAGSYEEAFVITEPMAKMDHAEAQYLLGLMYEFGHGVQKDAKNALEWFTKSASKGYAAAETKLGQLHSNDKDYGNAMDWFQKAANQGHALAYSALGDLYYNGYGVTKNIDIALNYYKKAATSGDADACLRLGKAYSEGGFVTADRTQALFWYKKGAELGNAACAAKVQELQ